MNKEKINEIFNKDELNKDELNKEDVKEVVKEVLKEVPEKINKKIDIDDNSLDIYADEESNGIGYELKI